MGRVRVFSSRFFRVFHIFALLAKGLGLGFFGRTFCVRIIRVSHGSCSYFDESSVLRGADPIRVLGS